MRRIGFVISVLSVLVVFGPARANSVTDRVRLIIADQVGVPVEVVQPEMRLREDLDATEDDEYEILMFTEEEFAIDFGADLFAVAARLATVQDFIDLTKETIAAK